MKTALTIIFCCFLCWGCKQEAKSCYDAELEKNHSGICTMDCPGVCGCDGQFYCNSCVAASKGIRTVEGDCDPPE